jgi:hypothetical protein
MDSWDQVGSADKDVERLYEFLLERGSPASGRELAVYLIGLRWRDEQEEIAQAAARTSPVYQPKQTYVTGQRVHFAAFGNREGTVKKIRAGDNPRLGEFQVMTVKFDDEPATRELSMNFTREHPLNRDQARVRESSGLSQQQIVEQYGEGIQTRIMQRLRSDKEFVRSADQVFLRELIPQINPGYLNLAEAAIEQSGDAIRTLDLLPILQMTDTKGPAATFAVNSAMASDPRFDNVGPTGDSRWYLTRLEPPEAIEYPQVLRAGHAQVATLAPEFETIAAELYDEADLNGNGQMMIAVPRDEITIILTYPHRSAGTLPLTPVRTLARFSRSNEIHA